MIPEGIHSSIPDEEYHKRELGVVSNTSLKYIRRSPSHYYSWVRGEFEIKDTPALTFGRAFDCALLTPDVFKEHYIERPKFIGKGSKAAKAEWEKEHADLESITMDDLMTIQRMVDKLRTHPLTSKMLEDGESQMTLSWTDPETGLKCKSRTDYYVRSLAMIADVKTCEDASEEAFLKSVVKYGYATQDALYRAAASALDLPIQFFAFIAIEKTHPFEPAIYQLDAESIGRGYVRVREGMSRMASCLKENRWPGYPERITELSLPPWG